LAAASRPRAAHPTPERLELHDRLEAEEIVVEVVRKLERGAAVLVRHRESLPEALGPG
jgi:hypothetical protein